MSKANIVIDSITYDGKSMADTILETKDETIAKSIENGMEVWGQNLYHAGFKNGFDSGAKTLLDLEIIFGCAVVVGIFGTKLVQEIHKKIAEKHNED